MTSWAIFPSAADKRNKKSNGNKKIKWTKCLCAPRTKWWKHIALWSSVFSWAHILTGPFSQLSYEQLACQGVLRIRGGHADLMHFRSKYIISQVLNFKKVNSSHGNTMRCTSAHNIKFLKFKKKRLTRRSSSTRREWEFGGLGSRLLWVGRGHPHRLFYPISLSEGNKSPRVAAGHLLGQRHCCLTHGRAPRTLSAVCTNPWKFMFHNTRSELFNVSITEGGECVSHQEVSGRSCHWQSIDQHKIHAKAFHGNMQSINTKETQKWGI